MADSAELKNMVMTFRVSELQMLLGFAGRNKTGRKTDLQARALELIRIRSTTIPAKIRELYRSIQQANASQGQTSSSPVLPPNPVDSTGSMQRTPFNQPNYNPTPQMNRSNTPSLPVYGQGMYHQYQPRLPVPNVAPSTRHQQHYPVHPDVKLKRLPFYDILAELIKPSTLVPSTASQRLQEATFMFHLTPQQATDICMSSNARPGTKGDYTVQVQLRFCLLETSCEQDDYFPPSVSVKVNNKVLQLPNPIPSNKQGVEPKRPPRPNNITPLLKLSPTVANHISVTWAPEYGRNYTISVYLVRKLSSLDLINRLKSRGVRQSDYTRGLIKEKLSEDADCEIATTSLRVALMCPLGKMRMSTPCRPSTCIHLQCFDASLFLQMNERKPTWTCPVCDKSAAYETLVIDGYFQEVLNSPRLPANCSEIQLLADGSWTILSSKKETNAQNISPVQTPKVEPQIETLLDEPEVLPGDTELASPPKKKAQPVVVDLTLSDSEDDAPATKQAVESAAADSSHLLTAVKHNYSDAASVSSSCSGSSRSSSSSVSSASGSHVRPSSVNSLVHSPNVITLDSPSPPPSTATNLTAAQVNTVPPPAHSNSSSPFLAHLSHQNSTMHPYSSISSLPSLPILDIDSDSSSSSHNQRTSGYQF
jgi:hypothetical protein